MEVGAFASMRCRCGKIECLPSSHVDSPQSASVAQILPPTVEPISYRLGLVVRFDDHAFDGNVEIDVEVRVDGLRSITTHSHNLAYADPASVQLLSDGRTALVCTGVVLDEAATTAKFKFGSPLPVGKSTLIIANYTGILNNQMAGFCARLLLLLVAAPTPARPCPDAS
jgi:hypothetical protein